jgi:hypothetical protein
LGIVLFTLWRPIVRVRNIVVDDDPVGVDRQDATAKRTGVPLVTVHQ